MAYPEKNFQGEKMWHHVGVASEYADSNTLMT